MEITVFALCENVDTHNLMFILSQKFTFIIVPNPIILFLHYLSGIDLLIFF